MTWLQSCDVFFFQIEFYWNKLVSADSDNGHKEQVMPDTCKD